MKFSCEKKTFYEAVSNVERAVSSKSTLPVLEGILLKALPEGSLRLSAYDLEIGMTTEINADIMETGEIVLNAKIFSGILRKMPAGNITVEVNDRLLATIKGGSTEFTILGMAAADFPDMPAPTECTNFSIRQSILASMIKQTLFCVSSDETKPVHTGSLFELSANQIRVVSVDGYRLAVRTEKITNDISLCFVVPGKTLSEILKMLDAESENPVKLSIGNRHILFDVNGFTITSRLLSGDFLDYHAVLSGKSSSEIKIKVQQFTDCIERASLLISDRLKTPVHCIFETDRVKIKCETNIGKSHDTIPAVYEGNPIEIGFNNRYLLDAMNAVDCNEVKILLNGPLSPMKIEPTDSDKFLYLVLPVRLNTQK